MHILVVDDEMVSRTKLETLMSTFGTCKTAENGGQALEIFTQALHNGDPFEVVMLDIDMPDMQGTDVLKRIRSMEREANGAGSQRALIVMVTAQADQDHVMTSVQNGCDDYISKPFNIKIIKEKLSKLILCGNGDKAKSKTGGPAEPTAESIFNEISTALRKDELRLPALPQIGVKFRELVRTNAELDDMAELLKKDMVVASKLIRVANSALYRGYGTVQTIEQAIGRVGLSEAEQLVTAITNQQLFLTGQPKYRDMLHLLWEHSLACAYGAEILCQSLARKLPIDPYIAGLFHDIGALALIDIIAEMDKMGRYGQGIDDAALLETVDRFHARFGAKLLEKWDFEKEYIFVTMFHNDLDSADSLTDELLIVHFANQVAKALGYTPFGQPPQVDLIDTPSAVKLKLIGPQIATLQHNVKTRMVKLDSLSS